MKYLAITQARSGSTRLPGKVLKTINGKSLLGHHIDRVKESQYIDIDQHLIATTDAQHDDAIAQLANQLGLPYYRGSEKDVLDRFYQAAKQYQPQNVIRLTGDCPLIHWQLIDQLIMEFEQRDLDYGTNALNNTFPDGLDAEVMTFQALEKAWQEATQPADREHVTPYIWRNSNLQNGRLFQGFELKSDEPAYADLRITVDEPVDFEVIEHLIQNLGPDKDWKHYANYLLNNPNVRNMNDQITRNEGFYKSQQASANKQDGTGQALYRKAKGLIPGGTMLLSKRPEMFLPEQWPSYFDKAEGCYIWDLDGNKYLDMFIMGIGTNSLGYGNKAVNDAVRDVVTKGNMSTFNAPEEVELAEKLIELHPWGDMMRFARSGGEANAMAIRIARAAAGKHTVAICGYHGWHDWYLSANLGEEDGLDGHLLPGLDPAGVPRNLRGSVVPFTYNNIDELKQIIVDYPDLGVVKMEVSRSTGPKEGYLEEIRRLCDEHNLVLIFDECTSGFRETYGGLHKKYGVEPDMCMFGKALGNGYAITGVLGKKAVMEAAQSTFISSTFWTERIGSAAALATLDEMKRQRSWEVITEMGKNITAKWQELGAKYELPIQTGGLPALTSFSIDSPDWMKYKTYITQEMLKKGILAGHTVYVCTAHDQEKIDYYFREVEPIFEQIAIFEKGEDSVDEHLEGPVCHSGFKRLN